MSKDQAWSEYFTLKARVASLMGFGVVPFLEGEYSWYLLAAAVFTATITVACEIDGRRLRAAIACVAMLPASWLIVRFVPSWYLQIVLVLGCVLAGLGAMLGGPEGSGNQEP